MYFHVWFSTKYRKPILKGEIEKLLKVVLTECFSRHSYKVLEFETNNDHAHLLVEAKSREELSAMVRTIKAVSAKELHNAPCFRMEHRVLVARKRNFWSRRYGYREIDEDEIGNMRDYIRKQKILHPTGRSL